MCMKCGCSTPNDKKTGAVNLPNGGSAQTIIKSSNSDKPTYKGS
jgi:hypothetical protein